MIRVKTENICEFILLVLIMFYVLIAHWIWVGRGVQESLMIFLSAVILLPKKIKSPRLKDCEEFVLVLLFVLFCTYTTLKAGSIPYFNSDIKFMAGTFIVALALIKTYKNKPDFSENFLNILFKWLNIYMFFNSFIIIAQYFSPYFMMNRSVLANMNNEAYFDQITGFLGMNGTTRWSIWSLLTIVLNFNRYYEYKNKKIFRYNIFFICLSLVLSMLNSSRGFFVSLPLTIIIYFLVVRRVSINVKFKYFVCLIAAFLAVGILYAISPTVKGLIDSSVGGKIELYASGDVDRMIASGDDRAAAVAAGVEYGGMYGEGIGSIPMHLAGDAEIRYLGLNSASSYIYMIGVFGYFLYAFVLARLVVTMCFGKDKLYIFKTIVFMIYFVILSYLLPIYSNIALLGGIFFIAMAFASNVKLENKLQPIDE